MLPVPKSSSKWLVTCLVFVTKRKAKKFEKSKNFLQSPLVNFSCYWLINQIALKVKRSPQTYIKAVSHTSHPVLNSRQWRLLRQVFCSFLSPPCGCHVLFFSLIIFSLFLFVRSKWLDPMVACTSDRGSCGFFIKFYCRACWQSPGLQMFSFVVVHQSCIFRIVFAFPKASRVGN